MSVRSPKIRVENLPGISVSSYREVTASTAPDRAIQPFTLLFIKPYQKTRDDAYGPPLGILTLIAGVRKHFGNAVTVHFWDMKLYNDEPKALAAKLDEYKPDVVGISALNCEAAASYKIASIVKAWNANSISVVGGPFTLRQAPLIFSESCFNWVFEGAADRTFLQALERQFSNQPLGSDIAGFSYRQGDSDVVYNHGQDIISDMDELPLPAWDMLDFERYRKRDRKRIITNIDERRYAYLFTSRGCPYLCSYCHDVFTKRFTYRGEESVLEEIRILYEDYGVTEFHIVDDIFNLHKPRAQSIMRAIGKRWPGKLYIAFPNGLRGDILDAETIAAMVEGGTYHATISIETVTPRLQTLVEKYLDIDKAKWSIEEFHRHGVIVQGAFMLGFPTETPEEIEATIAYAVSSPLTHVFFFAVVPQSNTPIYSLAMQESVAATTGAAQDERDNGAYASMEPWYSRAYGHDLHRIMGNAFARFYLHPPRLLRLLRIYPVVNLMIGGSFIFKRMLINIKKRLVSGFLATR
ncbi:MAG: B12-binding domain-containing radical SAM protein [bacterium]|nr:B12-binding domain-containing radical SAM protein [bacterium]